MSVREGRGSACDVPAITPPHFQPHFQPCFGDGSMGVHVGGRLTVAQVKAAGPGKHPDGANLWLQVGPNGSKSWLMRFTLNGRTREMGLGPYPLVSLSE